MTGYAQANEIGKGIGRLEVARKLVCRHNVMNVEVSRALRHTATDTAGAAVSEDSGAALLFPVRPIVGVTPRSRSIRRIVGARYTFGAAGHRAIEMLVFPLFAGRDTKPNAAGVARDKDGRESFGPAERRCARKATEDVCSCFQRTLASKLGATLFAGK